MRPVKLGRKWLAGPIALHWAVKVGCTWYEIEGADKNDTEPNKIIRSWKDKAKSGASERFGGLVGETEKTDTEIDAWIDAWLSANPTYEFTAENCQKFAYEFMGWLTEGKFTCHTRFNAAVTKGDQGKELISTRVERGNAVLRVGAPACRGSKHIMNISQGLPEFQAQAMFGTSGIGLWLDASFQKTELTCGNAAGAHLQLNLNTGIGVRNGNFEVHYLGKGFKIGADGVEINAPWGGYNACLLM